MTSESTTISTSGKSCQHLDLVFLNGASRIACTDCKLQWEIDKSQELSPAMLKRAELQERVWLQNPRRTA